MGFRHETRARYLARTGVRVVTPRVPCFLSELAILKDVDVDLTVVVFDQWLAVGETLNGQKAENLPGVKRDEEEEKKPEGPGRGHPIGDSRGSEAAPSFHRSLAVRMGYQPLYGLHA